MNNDPLLRESMDTELAARLARMTARSPRSSSRTTLPPSSPPPPPPPGAAPVRKKRRHPARHSRSAALALSFLTTSGLAYAFASTDTGATANLAAPAGIVTTAPPVTPAASSAPTVTAPATTASPSVTTIAPAPTATPTVVNGASFSNRFGDVQVQATFGADGSLTNVDVLRVPYRDGKSVAINNYAVPRLNSEALTAQSANVDTVSGATYTSIGYEQSLQSAIDAARANGITTIS